MRVQSANEVGSAQQAESLASSVTNPQRRTPLIVVTFEGRTSAVLEVDDLLAAVGVRADVAVLPGQWASAYNAKLPGLEVFKDAVRVYPPFPAGGGRPRCEVVLPQADLAEGLQRVMAQLPGRRAVGARVPVEARPPVQVGVARKELSQSVVQGRRLVRAGEALRCTVVEQADDLVAYLLSPDRVLPVVVVTVPAGATQPLIDAGQVASELGDAAEVVVLPTGRLTYRLSESVGPMSGVYGGAGRVYSPDRAWLQDPYSSRLRLVYDAEQGERATGALVGDALACVPVRSSSESTVEPVVASGVVEMVVPPSRAMVRLDDGSVAAVWAESVRGVSRIERLVRSGMRVSGLLDEASGRLDVADEVAAQPPASYVPGETVLVRVESVDTASMQVAVWPRWVASVKVDEVTGNPLDRLVDLVSPGEVMSALIVQRGATPDRWRFGLRTVDPDETPTVAPPSLLPDGPAWLTLPEVESGPVEPTPVPVPDAPAPEPAPVPDAPAPVPVPAPVQAVSEPTVAVAPLSARSAQAEIELAELRDRLEDLRAENAELRRDMQATYSDNASLRAQVEHLRTSNRKARSAARKGAAGQAAETVFGFADDEAQFRWEVQRSWVETLPPPDKVKHPLPDEWLIGEAFLGSLASVEGVSRDRVVAVVTRVLAGFNVPRGAHVLRTSEAGGTPAVVREDKATAWRVPLQHATPSARRLHFWKCQDGTIELSRIVVHDDYTP